MLLTETEKQAGKHNLGKQMVFNKDFQTIHILFMFKKKVWLSLWERILAVDHFKVVLHSQSDSPTGCHEKQKILHMSRGLCMFPKVSLKLDTITCVSQISHFLPFLVI